MYALNPDCKILVIRRDNIGDLICTTPLIRALRLRYPQARIDALVNSYNQPVLVGNPDIDHLYAYKKAKHREAGESVLGVYWQRLKLMVALRRTRYDVAILAGCGAHPARQLGLARQVGARHILSFAEADKPGAQHVDWPVKLSLQNGMHEVEKLGLLGIALDTGRAMPPLFLTPPREERAAAEQAVQTLKLENGSPLIAVHISARKELQRWPATNFIALIRALHQQYRAACMLFWSPGDENNPLHPGDDRKAAEIMAAVKDLPVLPYPTSRLEQLIGGLSVCDAMVCSDGGAMHVGAGLGKPIVCFFGNSDPACWHPWGVPYRVLRKPSENVADISPDETLAAFAELWQQTEKAQVPETH
jgi:ADP-heptose:LPS heptosyltransferase